MGRVTRSAGSPARALIALVAASVVLVASTSIVAARPLTIGLSSVTSLVEYRLVQYPATKHSAAYSRMDRIDPPTSVVTVADGLQLLRDGIGSDATAAWTPAPIDFSRARSLTATFTYAVSAAAGDGFAFAVQSDGPLVVGDWGGCLGYGTCAGMPAPTNPITTGFAVGVSQYANEVRLGVAGVWQAAASREDIDVDRTIVVRLTRSHSGTNGSVSVTIDGSSVVFTDPPLIPWPTAASYVGFTAGTGGATETLTITGLNVTLK